MTQNAALEDAIRRFGFYRMGFSSTVQFNSIIFRVLLGILFPEYASLISLFTVVEFTLNALLEVPFGVFADRHGRVKMSILGIVCFSLSVTANFGAVMSDDAFISKAFAVSAAILVGMGKPLFSGSVEAFYHDAILARRAGPQDDEVINSSFIVSANFGKTLPILYVLFSFTVLFMLWVIDLPKLGFVVGSALYLLSAFRLNKDYRHLGDPSLNHKALPNKSLLMKLIVSRAMIVTGFLKGINWAVVGYVLGHGIVILTNDKLGAGDFNKIFLYFTLMVGFMGPGWYLRGSVNPMLFKMLGARNSVVLAYGVFFLINILGFAIVPDASTSTLYVFVFIYATVFQISWSMWQDWSSNALLSSVDKTMYATALSIQNIPGFFMLAALNAYFYSIPRGYPGIFEMYCSIAAFSLAGALIVYFFVGKNGFEN